MAIMSETHAELREVACQRLALDLIKMHGIDNHNVIAQVVHNPELADEILYWWDEISKAVHLKPHCTIH